MVQSELGQLDLKRLEHPFLEQKDRLDSVHLELEHLCLERMEHLEWEHLGMGLPYQEQKGRLDLQHLDLLEREQNHCPGEDPHMACLEIVEEHRMACLAMMERHWLACLGPGVGFQLACLAKMEQAQLVSSNSLEDSLMAYLGKLGRDKKVGKEDKPGMDQHMGMGSGLENLKAFLAKREQDPKACLAEMAQQVTKEPQLAFLGPGMEQPKSLAMDVG